MPGDHEPNYENWNVRGRSEEGSYVGLTSGGVPVFYEQPKGELYAAHPSEEEQELIAEREEGPSMEPSETLGEAIERVGDELGWESLSEFAQEHLESGSASADGSDES